MNPIKFILIILLVQLVLTPLKSQRIGKLFLKGDQLIGLCEDPYFTGFEITLDSVYEELDSLSLFQQMPRTGFIQFKDTIQIETNFTVTNRAGFPQIMFKFKSSLLTFDDLVVSKDQISFTLDRDPKIPKTKIDLEIIKQTKSLLSSFEKWHKSDDRDCDDDNEKDSYSLYCALRKSAIEVEGIYNHRNGVMQEVRHLINQRYPNKKWKHRLADFNNMEETKYEAILSLLEEAERNIIKELEEKQNKKPD